MIDLTFICDKKKRKNQRKHTFTRKRMWRTHLENMLVMTSSMVLEIFLFCFYWFFNFQCPRQACWKIWEEMFTLFFYYSFLFLRRRRRSGAGGVSATLNRSERIKKLFSFLRRFVTIFFSLQGWFIFGSCGTFTSLCAHVSTWWIMVELYIYIYSEQQQQHQQNNM